MFLPVLPGLSGTIRERHRSALPRPSNTIGMAARPLSPDLGGAQQRGASNADASNDRPFARVSDDLDRRDRQDAWQRLVAAFRPAAGETCQSRNTARQSPVPVLRRACSPERPLAVA